MLVAVAFANKKLNSRRRTAAGLSSSRLLVMNATPAAIAFRGDDSWVG
jgi:hypothetical protein